MTFLGECLVVRVVAIVFTCLLLATPVAAQFEPPACAGEPFFDVPTSDDFCPWIQQLEADEITVGCGGGNYCPNNPVTRAQLAVMLGRAVHGTDAFQIDAGTLDGLDAAQFQRRYAKTATVAQLGTGDYADPGLAMADLGTWCGAPSMTNRCLLRVEPGIYTLSGPLLLPGHVDLAGAGVRMTRLEMAGTADEFAPVVLAEGEGEVRDVELRSAGGDHALGMLLKDATTRIVRRVEILALSATISNVAVRVTDGAAPLIEDSALRASGGPSATAVLVSEGSFTSRPVIRRSAIGAGGGASTACVGVAVVGRMTVNQIVDLRDVDILVTSCASATGVDAGLFSRVSMNGGSIAAVLASGDNVGLKTAAIVAAHVLRDVEVSAQDTAVVVGAGTGYVEIRDSSISGASAVSASGGSGGLYGLHSQFHGGLDAAAGSTVRIAASLIGGTVSGAGTFVCAGAFDAAFAELDIDCLP